MLFRIPRISLASRLVLTASLSLHSVFTVLSARLHQLSSPSLTPVTLQVQWDSPWDRSDHGEKIALFCPWVESSSFLCFWDLGYRKTPMIHGLRQLSVQQIDLGVGLRRDLRRPCFYFNRFGFNGFVTGTGACSHFGLGAELGAGSLSFAVNAYIPINFSPLSASTPSQVVYFPDAPAAHQKLLLCYLRPTPGLDIHCGLRQRRFPCLSGEICAEYKQGLHFFPAQNALQPHGWRASGYCRISPVPCFSIGVQYDLGAERRAPLRVLVQAQLRANHSWKQHLQPAWPAAQQRRASFVSRRHDKSLCYEPIGCEAPPKHLEARWKCFFASLFEWHCVSRDAMAGSAAQRENFLEALCQLASVRLIDKAFLSQRSVYHFIGICIHPDKAMLLPQFAEGLRNRIFQEFQALRENLESMPIVGNELVCSGIPNDSQSMLDFYASLGFPPSPGASLGASIPKASGSPSCCAMPPHADSVGLLALPFS